MNEGVNAARYRMDTSSPMADSVDSAGEPVPTNDGGCSGGGVDALCLEVGGMIRADRMVIPG